MIEAYLVKYYINTFSIGGPGPDKRMGMPAKAVYIPSEQILVEKDSHSHTYLISGPVHQMYTALIGEKANQTYQGLLKELKKAKPRKIKVSKNFVEWAKALHTAQNPTKGIEQMLDPFKS